MHNRVQNDRDLSLTNTIFTNKASLQPNSNRTYSFKHYSNDLVIRVGNRMMYGSLVRRPFSPTT